MMTLSRVIICGIWPAQGHTVSESQLVAVLCAVRAWTLGVTQATLVQALGVPSQEEEGRGLVLRGTWPLEEAACSLGASWSQGRKGEEPDTIGHLVLSLPGDLVSFWGTESGTCCARWPGVGEVGTFFVSPTQCQAHSRYCIPIFV